MMNTLTKIKDEIYSKKSLISDGEDYKLYKD